MLRSSINIQLQCIKGSAAHRRGQILSNKRGGSRTFMPKNPPQPSFKISRIAHWGKENTGVFSSQEQSLLLLRFLRYSRTFWTPCWFLLFSKSRILLNFLFLRYLSRVFSARKKNPCYFCDFCDICGHFGALLGFFAF